MSTTIDTLKPIAITEQCDQCSAQAMVRATLASGELYFAAIMQGQQAIN